MGKAFHSEFTEYDIWFSKNPNLFKSELKLLAHSLGSTPGRVLSVGCGSGLFETELRATYAIDIKEGLEPSLGMAAAAENRGLLVKIGTAEEGDMGKCEYDTILFNGCPGYIDDLEKAFQNAWKGLKQGGSILVLDVPKESPFGLFYNLASSLGSFEHRAIKGCCPDVPYPIEFVKEARWRTTEEKLQILKDCGFSSFSLSETLTTHPLHGNAAIEEPSKASGRGSYVAIKAIKGDRE